MKPALPETLPADPMPLLEQWLAEATGAIRNAVARIDPSRQTLRCATSSPSNACGLVTSWTTWRSM